MYPANGLICTPKQSKSKIFFIFLCKRLSIIFTLDFKHSASLGKFQISLFFFQTKFVSCSIHLNLSACLGVRMECISICLETILNRSLLSHLLISARYLPLGYHVRLRCSQEIFIRLKSSGMSLRKLNFLWHNQVVF